MCSHPSPFVSVILGFAFAYLHQFCICIRTGRYGRNGRKEAFWLMIGGFLFLLPAARLRAGGATGTSYHTNSTAVNHTDSTYPMVGGCSLVGWQFGIHTTKVTDPAEVRRQCAGLCDVRSQRATFCSFLFSFFHSFFPFSFLFSVLFSFFISFPILSRVFFGWDGTDRQALATMEIELTIPQVCPPATIVWGPPHFSTAISRDPWWKAQVH
ncbi:hypothetical protein BZA05DRAFT_197923 [Tricharina praecox]|uniref:uncharacterized protein n=1 Tax=Tricharina praecox TaxID=43433 RepID=UPI00221E8310|nr:uncharacterized protein BZA05DRAFT_197923 [Tricharina praecox]KAI5856315.1 hypothetical protein BZA05DRAFT_197923 [Tricharina praecox]